MQKTLSKKEKKKTKENDTNSKQVVEEKFKHNFKRIENKFLVDSL